MVEESELLTILFERKILRKNDEDIIFTYLPLEVVKGKESNFDGSKILSVPCKHVKTLRPVERENVMESPDTMEFNFIDDVCSMSEQYVYGFSLMIGNQDNKQIQQLKQYMIDDLEEIKQHTIFHTFKGRDGWSKLFITSNDLNININADNYYEIQDIMYGQFDNFALDMKKLINEEKERISEPSFNLYLPNNKILYSNQIFDRVSRTVISQDESVKKVAIAVAKNSVLVKPSLKSNLLVCGPTGVGKTEIFRSIHEQFDVPVAFEDSNEYTAASFKGKDVTEMLMHLYRNANGDIEKAQRGILIIDEIDKKAGKEHETFTSAVINSLLKMMEGHVYNVPVGNEEIEFDTSLLTFAFLGAFSGIEKYSNTRKTMGFITDEEKEKQDSANNLFTEETLKKYGLLPEFLGRCEIIKLNDLTEEDLIKIMKTSDKSQLLLYRDLYMSMGIKFIYDERTIEAIARKAIELKRGARSIKKIVEEALSIINYEVFSNRHFEELIISDETIEDNKKFILR